MPQFIPKRSSEKIEQQVFVLEKILKRKSDPTKEYALVNKIKKLREELRQTYDYEHLAR